MCTPWAMSKLAKWRVRDWALSFFACGLPLGEQSERRRSSSPQVSITNMVFDPKDQSRRNKKNKKKVCKGNNNRCKQDQKRVTSGSVHIQAVETGLAETRSTTHDDSSSWPHFADEDYIVFCFREDGAFDVVKDCKSETPTHIGCALKSPRRKLNYGEDAETVFNHTHEIVLKEDNPANKGESISDKEVEEEESIYLDTESPPFCGKRKGDQIMENEECGTVSVESNGSNQSDGSTGSFAFPVLRWELSGSPVQMPKSEGLRLRKHKARYVLLQCCRF